MCPPGTIEKVRDQVAGSPGAAIKRWTLIAPGVGTAAAAALPTTADASRPAKHRFQYLTDVLTEGFPVFTFDPPARETIVTIPDGGFYAQRWTLAEHSGTHMDAPGDFIEGGRLAPEITPQELIVPVVVVDIAEPAASDPDTVVTVDDLTAFERRHGRIPRGALACMDSGWAAKVGDPLAYKGGPRSPTTTFPASTSTPRCGSPSGGRHGDRSRHIEHRSGRLDHLPGPRRVPCDRPVRPGERQQSRQDPAARCGRLRRPDPVAGRGRAARAG